MSLAELLKKGGLRGTATATPATVATVATEVPEIAPSVASVATVAVANSPDNAANDPPAVLAPARAFVPIEPDRWAWPHSAAMTGAEIDTFTTRLTRFTDKGLDPDAGERLADELVIRDREGDDRRICLECTHLHRANGWRCGNWRAAGVACRSRDAQLPADLTTQLQRCAGFSACPTSMPIGADDEHDRF